MSDRPVIGVTSYGVKAAWGVWNTDAVVLPDAYVSALTGAGAVPLVIPVGSEASALLDRLDGLVLVGGPDLDPALYGAAPHSLAQPPSQVRDKTELELARRAGEMDLPLLAICRGLQVLNVARGGTLVQHLPEIVGHEGHSPGPGHYGRTHVHVVEDSRLRTIVSRTDLDVDCYHHQAIAQLGEGLRVVARADDGTIEAVEDPAARFCVAVQWHPEVGRDPSLFDAFVAAVNLPAPRGV